MAGNPLSHLSHNTMYFRDFLRENGTRKKIPEMSGMVVLVAEEVQVYWKRISVAV
jgi:hypothetical protein